MEEKMKILVVEDEIIIAQFLKMVLEDAGYQVCGLSPSGEDAIQKAVEELPDLILMDINLSSQMDGISAANEISKATKVAIIFMTGYPENNIEQRIENINYLAYLKKPVDISDLKNIIKDFFLTL